MSTGNHSAPRFSRNSLIKERRQQLIQQYHQYVTKMQKKQGVNLPEPQKTRGSHATMPPESRPESQESSDKHMGIMMFSRRFMTQESTALVTSPKGSRGRNYTESKSPNGMPKIGSNRQSQVTAPKTSQQTKKLKAFELSSLSNLPSAQNLHLTSPTNFNPKQKRFSQSGMVHYPLSPQHTKSRFDHSSTQAMSPLGFQGGPNLNFAATTQDSRERLSTTFFHNLSHINLNEPTQQDAPDSPRRSPSPTAAGGPQKKEKAGLSKFTLDYNEEMERVISQFEYRQTQNESKLIESNAERHDEASCQELLQKANQEIKTLNYRLNRIVGTEGTHKVLHVGMATELEAVQDVLIFCKVSLQGYVGQQIVFKLNVRLEGQSTKDAAASKEKHQITIYMSTMHKEPNVENNQLIFPFKKKLIYNPRGLPVVTDPKTGHPMPKDTLYVTFYSQKSCYINLQVMTLREYSNQLLLLKNPHMTAADLNNLGGGAKKKPAQKEVDYEEIDKELTRKLIKYEAQKNYLNREIGDFVTKNKFYQGFWRPEVQKEIINITRREEADKLDRAVKSKEDQEETERKRKYFFIHKWSLIKSRKQELLQQKIEARDHRQRLRFYLNMIQIQKMARLLMESYEHRKYLQRVHNRRVFSAVRLQRCIFRSILKTGPNFKLRHQKVIRNCFKIFHKVVQRPIVAQIKDIFVDFMEKTSLMYDFREKIMEFHSKVLKIQVTNQHRLLSIHHRFMLFDEFWEHVKGEMQTALKQNKKSKPKASKLVIKLFSISDRMKQKYFQLYFRSCKELFLVRFLNWRQLKLIEQGQQPLKEWSSEIPTLFESIKHHERLLFEDLDPFIEEATLQVAGPTVSPASERSRGSYGGGQPQQSSSGIKSVLTLKKYKDILKRSQGNYAKQVSDRDKYLKAVQEEEESQKAASKEDGGEVSKLKTPRALPPKVEAGPSPIFIFVPKKIQMVHMIAKALADSD